MHESGENYLETILVLENRNGWVRSIDIANELDYTKPSISRAMSILRRDGLIVMEDTGRILLTETGRAKAEAIYERHLLLSRFLIAALGVRPEIADQDACRIEHIISQETFEGVKRYLQVWEQREEGEQDGSEQ